MNDDNGADVKTNPDVTPETKESLEEKAAPVETSFASPARKRSPKKLILIAIIAAIIVALIGGSALGYSLWYQNPDKVVHDAVLNVIKAKTVSSTGTITFTRDDLKMDITFDSKSGENQGELSATAKITVDTPEMRQDFEMSGIGRAVNDTLYVKLSGVKSIAEDTAEQSGGLIPGYAANIFEKIEGRWISIKASDYQQINEDISKKQTCLTDLMEKMRPDSSLANEVTDLYRDNQIVIIKEELGSKDVNGTGSFGYKVGLDKDAAVSFTKGLGGTGFGKELKNCDEDIDFNEIVDEISKEVSENENEPVVELWVSRFGHEVTEVSASGNLNDKDAFTVILQPVFNKEITVEVPEDATSMKTVLQEIQQAILQHYMEMYSTIETLPESLDIEIDPQLQPTV